MKTRIFFTVLFAVAALALNAQQTAKDFYVTAPVSVRMPVQGDSINFKWGKFGVQELLKTPVSLDLDEWEYSKVAADTSGYVTVAKAEKDNLFYLFSTNVRASRFMHGTVKIYSSAKFEVYVDEQLKSSNTRSADTISKISPVSVSLRMEPQKDYKVIIAGAGMAAHLPGMCAALFPMPVIGVPISGKNLDGMDAVYSIMQMPPGIPVATVAIDGGANAGILAAKILATSNPEILDKLKAYSQEMKETVKGKAEKLDQLGYKEYIKQM